MIMVALDPDPRVAVFAVAIPSESKAGLAAGTFYDVALTPAGHWSCDCWRGLKDSACKHVLEARRVWAILRARRA